LDKESGESNSPTTDWNPFRKFSGQNSLGLSLGKSGLMKKWFDNRNECINEPILLLIFPQLVEDFK
jgi:hypothetical protein